MPGRKPTPLYEICPGRIALIKPSALGDIAHSLPILTALRRRYPAAHITWVVSQSYASVLQGHPDLDAVLSFDRGAMRGGWRASVRIFRHLLGEIRRQHFDLVIDLQGLLRTGLMCWASRARYRVGLSSAREGSRWFYSHVIPATNLSSEHAIDRYWQVIRALGGGEGPVEFRLRVDPFAETWADTVLKGYPRPWLVLGPGSRWETKRWLPEHFAALAQRGLKEFGGSVLLIGSSDESHLAQEVTRGIEGPTCDLTGATTLPQVVALLARADAVITNDTGPLHLAVALGRPVVAPYTCSKVSLTGPYLPSSSASGSQQMVDLHRPDPLLDRGGAAQTNVWCQGSLLRRCSRMECMAELTADRLWPLLHRVLLSWQQLRSA